MDNIRGTKERELSKAAVSVPAGWMDGKWMGVTTMHLEAPKRRKATLRSDVETMVRPIGSNPAQTGKIDCCCDYCPAGRPMGNVYIPPCASSGAPRCLPCPPHFHSRLSPPHPRGPSHLLIQSSPGSLMNVASAQSVLDRPW